MTVDREGRDVLERLPDGAQFSATWSKAADKWHVKLTIPEEHNAMRNSGTLLYAASGASLPGVAAILAYDFEGEELKRERAKKRAATRRANEARRKKR